MVKGDFPLLKKWYEISDWLMDRAEKFPKKVRFTFSNRIVDLTLKKELKKSYIMIIYLFFQKILKGSAKNEYKYNFKLINIITYFCCSIGVNGIKCFCAKK